MEEQKKVESIGLKKAKSAKAKYDPLKKWRWPQDASFSFSGGEFGVILNSLRQVLSTREAQTILLAQRASELIETALATAIDEGVAYEEADENEMPKQDPVGQESPVVEDSVS